MGTQVWVHIVWQEPACTRPVLGPVGEITHQFGRWNCEKLAQQDQYWHMDNTRDGRWTIFAHNWLVRQLLQLLSVLFVFSDPSLSFDCALSQLGEMCLCLSIVRHNDIYGLIWAYESIGLSHMGCLWCTVACDKKNSCVWLQEHVPTLMHTKRVKPDGQTRQTSHYYILFMFMVGRCHFSPKVT